MPRGGVRRIVTHMCRDGQERRVEPVYMRDYDDQGKRYFKRVTWFCGHCGYGLWVDGE